MPTSPYSRPTHTTNPWQLPTKSSALAPSVQQYTSDGRPVRYMPSSASPSPPSSPSLTTGGATYSVPASSYSPTPSSSSSPSLRSGSSRSSRHQSFDGVAGLGISSAAGDPLDYMSDRLSSTSLNPAYSAQQDTSPSALHAKSLELAALQALANARLTRAKTNFADGIAAAREVRADLEWTSAKVQDLNRRVAGDRRYAGAYGRVDRRVGRVVDEED